MKNNTTQDRKCSWWCCGCGKTGSICLGLLLLFLGGYFLAEDLGYITADVSFWPVVAIAYGLYLLIRGMMR